MYLYYEAVAIGLIAGCLWFLASVGLLHALEWVDRLADNDVFRDHD